MADLEPGLGATKRIGLGDRRSLVSAASAVSPAVRAGCAVVAVPRLAVPIPEGHADRQEGDDGQSPHPVTGVGPDPQHGGQGDSSGDNQPGRPGGKTLHLPKGTPLSTGRDSALRSGCFWCPYIETVQKFEGDAGRFATRPVPLGR